MLKLTDGQQRQQHGSNERLRTGERFRFGQRCNLSCCNPPVIGFLGLNLPRGCRGGNAVVGLATRASSTLLGKFVVALDAVDL